MTFPVDTLNRGLPWDDKNHYVLFSFFEKTLHMIEQVNLV